MNCTARCKQAEHRREVCGGGEHRRSKQAKQSRAKKGGGLWEEGEEERRKRQGSSILTTCTINNRGSAAVSWEQRMKRVWGFNMLRQPLAKSQSKRASHTRQGTPFLPLAPCHAPKHIFSHSLLAHLLPTHWLLSTEQQHVKHKAHHELNSRAGKRRYHQEVNKHCSRLARWGACTAFRCNMQGIKSYWKDLSLPFPFYLFC